MRYQRKKRCSVLGCGSDCSDPTIKFFHFPRNPDRLKIWKNFCANPAIEHLSHSNLKVHKYVCSRHFNSKEFLIYSRRSLRPIAADPSLKPPGDHSSSPSHSPSEFSIASPKTLAPITARSLTQKLGPSSTVSPSSVASSDGFSSDAFSSDDSSFDCPSFSASVQPKYVNSLHKDTSADHNYSLVPLFTLLLYVCAAF